jgi:hypothetical protein
VFQALRAQAWGNNVRLEQERIGWFGAMATVAHAIGRRDVGWRDDIVDDPPAVTVPEPERQG